MNEFDKVVNALIMREVGLEIGDDKKIYDQDSGMPIKINGVEVVAPGSYSSRCTIEFDPYNNRKQMGQIFNYFINKQYEEGGREVLAYYNKDDTPQGGKVECKLDDDTVITSEKYGRDTLKYTDIIMRLNGDENPDLKQYDVPMTRDTIKPNFSRKKSKV